MAPSRHQDGINNLKDSPKMAQDGPRWTQDAPKLAPEEPNTAQDSPTQPRECACTWALLVALVRDILNRVEAKSRKDSLRWRIPVDV